MCKRVYMLTLFREFVINNLQSKNIYEHCYNINPDTLLKADYFLRYLETFVSEDNKSLPSIYSLSMVDKNTN